MIVPDLYLIMRLRLDLLWPEIVDVGLLAEVDGPKESGVFRPGRLK